MKKKIQINNVNKKRLKFILIYFWLEREQFLKTEDRSRPEWEDIDSREGGQYENQLLQDKRIIFGDQYLESKGGSSPSKKGNGRDITQAKQDPNEKSSNLIFR